LTLFFEVNIGFAAITIALALVLISPQLQKGAVGQVTWPEILLITGVGTYVGVLQEMGTHRLRRRGRRRSHLAALLPAAGAYGALVTVLAPIVLWFVFVVVLG
jgi:hypothetical protein